MSELMKRGFSNPPPRRLFTEYPLEQQRLLLYQALESAVQYAVERGFKPRCIVVSADMLLRALGLPDIPGNRVSLLNVAKELRGSRFDAGGARWTVTMRMRRKGRGQHARRIHLLVLERVG